MYIFIIMFIHIHIYKYLLTSKNREEKSIYKFVSNAAYTRENHTHDSIQTGYGRMCVCSKSEFLKLLASGIAAYLCSWPGFSLLLRSWNSGFNIPRFGCVNGSGAYMEVAPYSRRKPYPLILEKVGVSNLNP